jgi:hypothetical protein
MDHFYRGAARKETLEHAFKTAVKKVVSSPRAKNIRHLKKRFHLLPAKDDIEGYHDIPVFFNMMVPATKEKDFFEGFMHIPHVPNHFIGREVDMYDILESIRVDDIVKVTGTPGYGKETVVAAVADYAMQRRRTFAIDDVFWIPPPDGVEAEPDSLYGDLCLCSNLIRTSTEDIWDSNDLILECRERLEIEMEVLKMILVVDDRSFSSKGSQDALEKFISFIVDNATAKVILITARANESSSLLTKSTHGSRIEESSIEINTLDFRSSALLFGGISKFIFSNGCPVAHSAHEFAELLEPPFVANMADPSVVNSKRRAELFARLGNGLPAAVIAAATSMDKSDFMELIKIANKPEFFVDSLSELETELRRRVAQKEKAVADKNYMRAMDLDSTIQELENLKSEFPTLKDLKEEEQVMKSELADAVANRRYDAANDLKRDLLVLKKKIMKERRLFPDQSENPNNRLNEFQAQMDSMMERTEDSLKLEDLDRKVSFKVDCDNSRCIFSIYYGEIFDFKHPAEAKGVVYWCNEACDLSSSLVGQRLLEIGGEVLKKDIESLPIVVQNQYGAVRCETGNAVILGPSRTYRQTLPAPVVILSVGPYSPPGSSHSDTLYEGDQDYFHYSKMMLRSCYRSSLVLSRHSELQALGVVLLTTRKKGPEYEQTIQVGLQTLVEEVQASHLKDVHILATTPEEASLMVRLMQKMGYAMQYDHDG